MAGKRQTVLQSCVEVLGVHKGAVAAANVAQYVIATAELGHVPSSSEYRDYWAISDRSSWYHRSRIEAVYGDQWRLVVEQLAKRLDERSPRAVMRLTAPRSAHAAA